MTMLIGNRVIEGGSFVVPPRTNDVVIRIGVVDVQLNFDPLNRDVVLIRPTNREANIFLGGLPDGEATAVEFFDFSGTKEDTEHLALVIHRVGDPLYRVVSYSLYKPRSAA